MTKKRTLPQKNKRPAPQAPASPAARPPSVYTLFRMANASPRAREAFEKGSGKFKASFWQRHHQELQQIRKAGTAEALVDQAGQAVGLLGITWHHRAREFGDEILPLIAGRLKTISGLADSRARIQVVETLVGELRWRGAAGAEVLQDRFDSLDYHGRSLTCVALGLLEAQKAADKIWRFYEKTLPQKDSPYFVGALWGLIDLKDERAADTLFYLISKPRYFYELFGFLARAGDERAILPLMKVSMAADPQGNQDAMLALASIGYRVGREGLVAKIEQITSGDDDPETSSEKVADMILSYPPDLVHRYFGIFQESMDSDLAEKVAEPLQEGQTI